jgi:hypothetical protein
MKTLLLVALAKKQHTRDDELTISCINQDKNIELMRPVMSTKFLVLKRSQKTTFSPGQTKNKDDKIESFGSYNLPTLRNYRKM